jgi:YVTN family beta-propeller protein
MLLPILLWVACGQVYRPVVIPCSGGGGIPGCPVEPPPTPANFHAAFGISANLPNFPGGAMQIDVAGDAIIAETSNSDPKFGNNPTHAAILPNNTRLFVATAGSVTGGLDGVASFSPAFQSTTATGFGPVSAIALPTGSLPVFVNTTQNNAVYVANFGTNSVSAINPTLNVVINTASVGVHPVALAEIPNGNKLYVANQGDNTISSLNPADLSSNVVTGFSGTTPVWMVARGDSQKVYVLTQGDGKLVTIDTATDTATTPDCSVTPALCVGPGANFIFFDPNLNRLYVTNPLTDLVYVFSDTGGANDTPTLLTPNGLAIPGLSPHTTPACLTCSPVVPVSVTALADGTRFYVAGYQTASPCPDSFVGAAACMIPELTVFDANSFGVEYPLAPTLTLLTYPPFAANLATNQYQYAVPAPPGDACALSPLWPALYAPSVPRFRVFTVAAVDSSRVYVSICDAGVIAVINTTNNNINNSGGTGTPADTLVTDLPAAFSAGAIQSNGEPPNQNPIFMLTGQ